MTDYNVICHACKEQLSYINGPCHEELFPFMKFHSKRACRIECFTNDDSSFGDWFDTEEFRNTYKHRITKEPIDRAVFDAMTPLTQTQGGTVGDVRTIVDKQE